MQDFVKRYRQACVRAGEAGYKIKILTDELEEIHAEIKQINVDAHKAQKAFQAEEALREEGIQIEQDMVTREKRR